MTTHGSQFGGLANSLSPICAFIMMARIVIKELVLQRLPFCISLVAERRSCRDSAWTGVVQAKKEGQEVDEGKAFRTAEKHVACSKKRGLCPKQLGPWCRASKTGCFKAFAWLSVRTHTATHPAFQIGRAHV